MIELELFKKVDKDEFDIENLTENDDEQVIGNQIQIKVFKTFTAKCNPNSNPQIYIAKLAYLTKCHDFR